MKTLILTPINPVLTAELYRRLTQKYNKTNVDVISFPFLADMQSVLENKSYVLSYFAMILTSIRPEIHKKIFRKQKTIVIGNTYKEEEFDFILSFGADRNEIFDTYLEMIKIDEGLEFLKNNAYIENLYSLEDATINLPTIGHVELFLEGVYK
jgi:hypothetical protein